MDRHRYFLYESVVWSRSTRRFWTAALVLTTTRSLLLAAARASRRQKGRAEARPLAPPRKYSSTHSGRKGLPSALARCHADQAWRAQIPPHRTHTGAHRTGAAPSRKWISQRRRITDQRWRRCSIHRLRRRPRLLLRRQQEHEPPQMRSPMTPRGCERASQAARPNPIRRSRSLACCACSFPLARFHSCRCPVPPLLVAE